MRALLLLLVCTSLANGAFAAGQIEAEQQASSNALLLPAPAAAGTVAPAAPLVHALQLSATSDGSTASAKLALGEPSERTSANLIVSVPLNKGEDRTALWNKDQTINGTNIEFRIQRWQLQGVSAPDDAAVTACIAAMKKAQRKEEPGQPPGCDLGVAKASLTEAEYLQLRDLFFPPASAALNYGGGVSVSFKDFTYYDPATLNKQKDRQRGAGANLFLAYQPLSSASLYIAKAEVARTYKEGDSQIACLAVSTPVLQCVQGSLAAPEKQLAKIISLEYRTYLGKGAALAVQLARDLSSNTSSVQVPLYLIGNGKDSLTGGIALSYTTDDHKVGVAVFVAQGFALR